MPCLRVANTAWPSYCCIARSISNKTDRETDRDTETGRERDKETSAGGSSGVKCLSDNCTLTTVAARSVDTHSVHTRRTSLSRTLILICTHTHVYTWTERHGSVMCHCHSQLHCSFSIICHLLLDGESTSLPGWRNFTGYRYRTFISVCNQPATQDQFSLPPLQGR